MLKPPATGPDSHLSQRGESRIHASCKSAGSQGQPKRQDLVLICHPFKCESSVMGGLPGCESTRLSDPVTLTSPLGIFAGGSVSK